jgi:hypothetical protein
VPSDRVARAKSPFARVVDALSADRRICKSVR